MRSRINLNKSGSILTVSRTRTCRVNCENEQDECNPNWMHFECKLYIYRNKLRNQVEKLMMKKRERLIYQTLIHEFIGG